MTDEDRGYWGLRAWLWSLIKNHCALGRLCHCPQPLPVCSCGSFPWRDERAVRYQLNYYCIFFGSASSARILNVPGRFQLSLKACDIEHNRDQIQLHSANKQQTWALPVTIPAPLLCQSLWKRRCRTMKEPLGLLMWETLIVAALFGTEGKRMNSSIFAGVILHVPERTPITSLPSHGAKLLSGSNKAHAGSEEDQIWKNQWQTLSC